MFSAVSADRLDSVIELFPKNTRLIIIIRKMKGNKSQNEALKNSHKNIYRYAMHCHENWFRFFSLPSQETQGRQYRVQAALLMPSLLIYF